MFSFKCAEVNGADRCGGRRMVQLGFSIFLPILLLALAHDIVVFLGYHFGRPFLINWSIFFLQAQSTEDSAGLIRLKLMSLQRNCYTVCIAQLCQKKKY